MFTNEEQIKKIFIDSWAVDNFLAIDELDEPYKGGLYKKTLGSSSYTSNMVDRFKETGLIELKKEENKRKIYEYTEEGEKLKEMFSNYFPSIRSDD